MKLKLISLRFTDGSPRLLSGELDGVAVRPNSPAGGWGRSIEGGIFESLKLDRIDSFSKENQTFRLVFTLVADRSVKTGHVDVVKNECGLILLPDFKVLIPYALDADPFSNRPIIQIIR